MRRYTVGALNREIQALLGGRYPAVEVEGEVVQVSLPASGHAYVTLRDVPDRPGTSGGQLNCVVWADTWRRTTYRPKNGDRVVCRGKVNGYPEKGTYQLYVTAIEAAGLGALQAQIAQRIARLQADGLLDPAKKRPLPRAPRFVGVATSRTGAALADFLKVSRDRFPAARILVAPCVVQGAEAASSVIRALDLLVEDGRSEVIVVTRGGGSKEDLAPFQDEQLARAIAACPIPVVSAVGHQIDTTIADLVADAVAPTPSAAALRVLPDGPALSQRVDEAAMALEAVMRRGLLVRRRKVETLLLRNRHPRERLAAIHRRAGDLEERLRRALDRRVERAHARVRAASGRLEALSPVAVLGRGYAIVLGPSGVVTDASAVADGDRLDVRLAQGALDAVVTGRKPRS